MADHHRSQGLRVGCPLTPLLVSICLLPLINSINCENVFLGPKVQRETIKSVIDEDRALIFLPIRMRLWIVLKDAQGFY